MQKIQFSFYKPNFDFHFSTHPTSLTSPYILYIYRHSCWMYGTLMRHINTSVYRTIYRVMSPFPYIYLYMQSKAAVYAILSRSNGIYISIGIYIYLIANHSLKSIYMSYPSIYIRLYVESILAIDLLLNK